MRARHAIGELHVGLELQAFAHVLCAAHAYVDKMVGAGRFELPTPCSRSKCATRLRYAPPDRQPENGQRLDVLDGGASGEGGFIAAGARPGKRAILGGIVPN